MRPRRKKRLKDFFLKKGFFFKKKDFFPRLIIFNYSSYSLSFFLSVVDVLKVTTFLDLITIVVWVFGLRPFRECLE